MDGLIAGLIEEEIEKCGGVIPFCYTYPYLESIRHYLYYVEKASDKLANYYLKITLDEKEGQVSFRQYEYDESSKQWFQYQDITRFYPCSLPMKRNGLYLADLPAELVCSTKPTIKTESPSCWWLPDYQNRDTKKDGEFDLEEFKKLMGGWTTTKPFTTSPNTNIPWTTGPVKTSPAIGTGIDPVGITDWNPKWIYKPNEFWSEQRPLGYSFPSYTYTCTSKTSVALDDK